MKRVWFPFVMVGLSMLLVGPSSTMISGPGIAHAGINCTFAMTKSEKEYCAAERENLWARYRAIADKQGIKLHDRENWGTPGFDGVADAQYGYIGRGTYRYCDQSTASEAREDFFFSERRDKLQYCAKVDAAQKQWDQLPPTFTW